MTRAEVRSAVLVRLGKDTTSAWTSETILNDIVNQSHRWAAAYKKWPFTERRDYTQAYTSGTEQYSYPSDFKSDSIRLLQVGGERLQKLNWEDYQIFREEQSDSQQKVYSDFGRSYYINPNADVSGTVAAWGQYTPSEIADGDENDTSTTVFSGGEEEGNEAIINEAMSHVLRRDGKEDEAINRHKLAMAYLEEIWQRIGAEQYQYHSKNRGIWKRFDVVDGALQDEIRDIDRWY